MREASAPPSADPTALRAEHDVLAAQLESRRSIDVGRRGLYQLFTGLIAMGASLALAWDRWGPLKPGVVRKAFHGRPLFLYVAVAATVVLLLLAIRSLARSRVLMREEDARFERLRQLRAQLRLDT